MYIVHEGHVDDKHNQGSIVREKFHFLFFSNKSKILLNYFHDTNLQTNLDCSHDVKELMSDGDVFDTRLVVPFTLTLTMCSKYSKVSNQHDWGDLCDHLMSMRIFT
jgi:hypothetical protein